MKKALIFSTILFIATAGCYYLVKDYYDNKKFEETMNRIHFESFAKYPACKNLNKTKTALIKYCDTLYRDIEISLETNIELGTVFYQFLDRIKRFQSETEHRLSLSPYDPSYIQQDYSEHIIRQIKNLDNWYRLSEADDCTDTITFPHATYRTLAKSLKTCREGIIKKIDRDKSYQKELENLIQVYKAKDESFQSELEVSINEIKNRYKNNQ